VIKHVNIVMVRVIKNAINVQKGITLTKTKHAKNVQILVKPVQIAIQIIVHLVIRIFY